MYNLINNHLKQILDTIEHNHVSDYDWLIQNLNDIAAPNYQRKYRTFWRLNAALLSPDYCQVYFARLGAGLINKITPRLDDLAIELYDIPTHQNGRQSLQFSFCSKLCHMLNNQMPIYDGLIRNFYYFEEPDRKLPLHKRVNQYVRFHQFLVNEYNRILNQGLLTPSIRAFRQRFNPQHFTDIKVIDSLIWAFIGKLKNSGLIDGEIIYS